MPTILTECMEIDPSFSSLQDAGQDLVNYRGETEYDLSAAGFPSVEEAMQCRIHAQLIRKFVTQKLKAMGYTELP